MFKYKYEDNNGNEEIYEYEDEKEMLADISSVMQDIYDNMCAAYEDADVTWLNRLFDISKTSEIYVPDTSIFFRFILLDEEEI